MNKKIDKNKCRDVFERNVGKSFALNMGMKDARGYNCLHRYEGIFDRSRLVDICRKFQSDPELFIPGGSVELYDK